MPTPDRLLDLITPGVRDATRAYLTSRDAPAFERAMQQALAKAHTAAYVRGLAERSAGGQVRAWLARLIGDRALPKEARAAIKATLAREFDFLRGFMRAMPDLTGAQVAQRAALYVGAARATFWQARTNNALPLYPGSCPQCFGRCRCSIEQRGDGFYWNSANDDRTCAGCRQRGADWQPYKG